MTLQVTFTFLAPFDFFTVHVTFALRPGAPCGPRGPRGPCPPLGPCGPLGPGRRSASTNRIAWLPSSAIRKPPSAVAATPPGNASLAAVAGPPSPVEPDIERVPATVVILPAGEARRSAPLLVSAIRKPPSAVAPTPAGALSLAP